MEVRIQDGRNAIGDVTIEAGTAIELSFPYQFVTWGSRELNITPGTGTGLFFVGHIIYTDDTGMQQRRRYNSVFRRQYRPEARRFYPVNDTELEYAD